MPFALWLFLLMLAAQLGAALSTTNQHWCAVFAGLAAALLLICKAFSVKAWKAVCLAGLLCCLLLRSAKGLAALPGPLDPLHLVPKSAAQEPLVLEGKTLADAPVRNGRCQVLVQVERIGGRFRDGRTELVANPNMMAYSLHNATTPNDECRWLQPKASRLLVSEAFF